MGLGMKRDNEKQEPAVAADEAALNEEASRELEAMVAEAESSATSATGADSSSEPAPYALQSQAERAGVIEALIFVSEEPLSGKIIAEVLKEDRGVIDEALSLYLLKSSMSETGAYSCGKSPGVGSLLLVRSITSMCARF